ncbi:N-acetylgalactosamine-6-sulfatase [Procambarus clarkii]|uniref:N-acetylgalactosamine-6-sulfatase n=1 Tax=Procambarus clarkii TaxID=6728 RepID=UPI001E670500|nr:N-acetylgalactosamine-6-sulfatase-like [Procambarus clarkii]
MAADGVRGFLKTVGLVLVVLAPAASQPPNVIIMLMDDMGWGDLGANGEPSRETPNIDQMGREGLTVTSMYTAAPLCSPTRAALLTGRLPIRNGFYSNNTHGMNAYTPQEIVGGISSSEILLPELLRPQGYTSGIIGKWHLGHRSPYLPLKRGFDFFYGSTNCHLGPYDDVTTPNIPVFRNASMIGRYFEDFPIDKSAAVSNMTQLFTEEAVGFIERQAPQGPFFLLWAPDATHAPEYASDKFHGTSRRGHYGDAVRELDAGVGALLDALRRSGVHNNTLVVFTSDNGAALVSKQDGGSNGPFLCGKQTTFEGGMRAPGIFWWPGVLTPGAVSHQVWTQMDLFTTVLELAGVTPPGDRHLDGLPLTNSLLYPDHLVLRPVFLYRGDRLMAVRQGAYKLHLWTFSTPPEELSVGINFCPGAEVENVTTPIPTDHSDQPVLFNIEVDPAERYPIPSGSSVYKKQVPVLLEVVSEHLTELVPGEPQLNWCDPAVMHWAPPGCEALGRCLEVPPSDPTLCVWPH